MIGAKEDLDNIEKQFISVNELLDIFSRCENTTIQESAQWLKNNIHILRRNKRLVLENSHTLVDYRYNERNFYNCPIEAITFIAEGEDYQPFNDNVGFARLLILLDLKELNMDINSKLIEDSRPYIGKESLESDDNFYKNQCINLIRLYSEKPMQSLESKGSNINYIQYIDPNDDAYVPAYALLLRLHHDINTIERYEQESTKQKRIRMCLGEYGDQYNCQDTSTNADHYSNLIKVRKDAKIKTCQTMKEILNTEQNY